MTSLAQLQASLQSFVPAWPPAAEEIFSSSDSQESQEDHLVLCAVISPVATETQAACHSMMTPLAKAHSGLSPLMNTTLPLTTAPHQPSSMFYPHSALVTTDTLALVSKLKKT